MNGNGWSEAFGELARATMSSPELERYYSLPISRPRAQLILKQLSLYVRHRRDCWASTPANPGRPSGQSVVGRYHPGVGHERRAARQPLPR